MKCWMALAALTAFATPAAAGDLPRLAQAMDLMPPYEVLTIVRSAGLDPIGRPTRRGPTYVLHAIDDDDREVRVVVDARYGDIVSITPVMAAWRDPRARELPPRRGMGPYERTPEGYPPRYRSGPPIVYESDPPLERPRAGLPDDPGYAGRALPPPARRAEPPPVIYGDRPSARGDEPRYGSPAARGAGQPPVIAATPPDGIERRSLSPPRSTTPGVPQASIEPDIAPGRDGLLPPPPERFPQRAPPTAAKPTPPKRAVAASPKQAPLPKRRPQELPAASTGGAAGAEPAPPLKADADGVPH